MVEAVDPLLDVSESGTIAVSTHGTVLALYLHTLDDRYGFDFWCGLEMPDAYEVVRDAGGRTHIARLARTVGE